MEKVFSSCEGGAIMNNDIFCIKIFQLFIFQQLDGLQNDISMSNAFCHEV